MKRILLVSDGFFHPPLPARKVLKETLESMPDISVSQVNSLEKLPSELQGFSALVLYFHHKKISDHAFKRFDNFIINGGGILAVHSASASFKKDDRFYKILGGQFSGHGKVESFPIQPEKPGVIFSLEQEFSVKDELYLHDFQPGIQVHFTSPFHDQHVPVVWTKYHGKGKVCNIVPGHRTTTLRDKNIQQIIQQGLQWVVGNEQA